MTNSPDWKGLKEKKQQELPAAEITRKKREERYQKRILKITDTVERNIYKSCKHQEAGTTVMYNITDHGSVLGFLKDMFLLINDWTWYDEIKTQVEQNIVDRLTAQGIRCEKVEDIYFVKITLP